VLAASRSRHGDIGGWQDVTVEFGIKAYEHVGIRVCDKAVSVAFYEQLGFHVTEDFPEHAAMEMANSDGVRINLIYNGAARANNILMDEAIKHPGLTHPAFVVASLDACLEALAQADIAITEGPIEIGGRRRICFVRDPDGNVVEFDELLSSE
jgi:lactoylglutathione lyase